MKSIPVASSVSKLRLKICINSEQNGQILKETWWYKFYDMCLLIQIDKGALLKPSLREAFKKNCNKCYIWADPPPIVTKNTMYFF